MIEKKLFEAKQTPPWKPWLFASIAAFLILGIAIVLMKITGLLDIPEDDPGAKTIAAALALVGSVLASAVTLIGTVVKYSIDDRNYSLAYAESVRNHFQSQEASTRNRIEVALRAVDLLSENNKDSTPDQIGGALLALVSLGELSLALALVAELWPNGKVSPIIADRILSKAFQSESKEDISDASVILFQNADKITQGDYHIWPFSDNGWNKEYPTLARSTIAKAAAIWFVGDLRKKKDELPIASIVLYEVLLDPVDYVKAFGIVCLENLISHIPENQTIYEGPDKVSIEDIKKRLSDLPQTKSSYKYSMGIKSQINQIYLIDE